MEITNIKIRKIVHDSKLKAIVSITLDHLVAIHDIKIIQGPERLFVAMPSRRDDSNVFRDIVHPITPEGRAIFEDAVLTEYLKLTEEPHV